jgi:hypothetical protein
VWTGTVKFTDDTVQTTAAAISLAVTSTGVFGRVHTHELIPAEELPALLERAKSARQSYRPPGA